MIRMDLNSKEYEIMKVMWDSDRPMLVSEIVAKTKNVSDGSVHKIINKLEQRGFIEVVGRVRVVKSPGRLYAPALSLTEYMANLTKEVYRFNNRAIDLKELLNYIIKKDKNKNSEYLKAVEEFLVECQNDKKENENE